MDESKKGSEFVFDYAHLLYYKCHKIDPNCGGLYMNSPDWIKKATKNPINKKDNTCFQYTIIKKDLQRITKFQRLINKYNCEGINFPSEIDDWKKFEKNKVTIFHVLHAKKEKICPAYVSKHNPNREQQVVFLMIPNGKKTRSQAQRTMSLSCSKKTISIIKKNNIKK